MANVEVAITEAAAAADGPLLRLWIASDDKTIEEGTGSVSLLTIGSTFF